MLMFFSMYFMLNPPVLMSLQEAPEIYWWGSSPPLPLKKERESEFRIIGLATCLKYLSAAQLC